MPRVFWNSGSSMVIVFEFVEESLFPTPQPTMHFVAPLLKLWIHFYLVCLVPFFFSRRLPQTPSGDPRDQGRAADFNPAGGKKVVGRIMDGMGMGHGP